MSGQNKEEMPELLSDKSIFGLNDKGLTESEKDYPEFGDEFFEPAAMEILNLDTGEPIPLRLRRKIAADAKKYFASQREEKKASRKIFGFESNRLGWAFAAFASVILAVNLYTTRINPAIVEIKSPPKIELSPAREREHLIASAKDIVRSDWGDFNRQEPKNIQGDVVWSSSAQKGFVRFRNLPVNDKTKQQYQLWIFDENQQYPIDGGVFDADAAGEIVIPIDAKIKVQKPTMFAVTAEKAGGVVVSSREKVMAIAKISA